MRRRLLLSTCLIAVAAVVVLGVPLGVVGTALLRNRAEMRLERRADAAAIRLARADARHEPLTTPVVAGVLRAGEALRVTADGHTTTLGSRPSGDTVTVTSGDGGAVGVALIAPASAGDDDVRVVWLTVAGLALAAVLAAAGLALLQARRLAQPLERLARRVERVGHPDYDAAPLAGRMPEVDEVQLALNDADQRIAELVRRERQFTANASHQLRTPLTGLRMRLEELHAMAESGAAVEETDAAMRQVDRLVATIAHLEALARHRDDEPDLLDVGDLVSAHVTDGRWDERFGRAGRRLDVDLAPRAIARVRAEALRQIVDVLLDNALRHGCGRAALRLDVEASWVQLRVEDEGATPIEDAHRIFERGVGSGTGVGLAVAREIARRSGGELRLLPGPRTAFEALLAVAVDGRSDAVAEPVRRVAER